MVGRVVCGVCASKPTSNDSKFYHTRFTTSGKDDGIGRIDQKVCIKCLVELLNSETKLGTLESARRIENPLPEAI